MLKKLIIIGFSFLLLSNLHLNKEEVKTMDTTIDNDTLVLHFADDDRMPFHLYSDWLVGSSFTKGIYGTITHLTPNGLFITDHEDSILDFIEREEGEPATKFILKIKEGLYFEKAGKKIEFTASDLKFSYAIPFFLKKPDIFEKSALKIIKGMDKIIPGETYSDDKITGITILDKYTVKIELNHLDSHVITNLSSSRYPIVSKEFYLEKLKNSSEELTPGLGKYETLSINKLTGETLLKRKKAVAGFPTYIKYISNKDLQQGDILWSSANIWENKVPKHYQKQVDSIPAETAGIFFNFKTVLGNDPKFRKAISIAINRDKITKNSDFLIPNAQILPNGYWGRIETEDKYNIELAKKLLSQINNIPDPFIISGPLSENDLKLPYVVELLDQLKDIGLNPKFELQDSEEPFKSIIVLSGIAVPYKNPVSVFEFLTEGSFYENLYPKNDQFIFENLNSLNTASNDKDKLIFAKKLSQYIYDSTSKDF